MASSIAPRELAATLTARRRTARAADDERAARLLPAVRRAAAIARAEGAIDAAWLVGSLAWGAFGERSDVDVVVRGADAATIGALAARFEDAIDARVDVMRLEELGERFVRRVLDDGIRIDEP